MANITEDVVKFNDKKNSADTKKKEQIHTEMMDQVNDSLGVIVTKISTKYGIDRHLATDMVIDYLSAIVMSYDLDKHGD